MKQFQPNREILTAQPTSLCENHCPSTEFLSLVKCQKVVSALLFHQPFKKTIFYSTYSLSHPGIRRSTNLISDRYHWPSLKADLKRWCQTCVPRQQSKVQRHIVSPLPPIATSSNRFENIHVDLVGPLCYSQDHCYPPTIIDRTTRWPEAIPLKDTTAKSCVDAFVLHFVSRF